MLKHKYPFEAFGTNWEIDTAQEIPKPLKQKIQKRINEFESVYSRFRNDSLVCKIAKKPGTYLFPNDAVKLFEFYKILYLLTDGKVTPLIGDMISRAGYDAEYSFKTQLQKSLNSWEDSMSWEGATVTTQLPIILDVGAAGKGYMIDIIAEILGESNINEYVIDASGDLRQKGASENKVGLEHPLDTSKVIGVVDVRNKSLCASATNRRAWGKGMHHIFDPDTMSPSKDFIATWVMADDAMIADGIATALFFANPNTLKKEFDFEYVRIDSDGIIEYSAFFESKLF